MKFLITLFFVILFTCNNHKETESVDLCVHNNSGEKIDSIYIYFLNDKKVIKNIEVDKKLSLKFSIRKNEIPKGERSVFYIIAFKNDYFLTQSNGFIGFPYAKMDDYYEFYIFNDYIANEKNFVPTQKPEKQKISQFK